MPIRLVQKECGFLHVRMFSPAQRTVESWPLECLEGFLFTCRTKSFPAVSPPVSADESMLRTAGAYVMSSWMRSVSNPRDGTDSSEETKNRKRQTGPPAKTGSQAPMGHRGFVCGRTLVVCCHSHLRVVPGKDGMANDVVKNRF